MLNFLIECGKGLKQGLETPTPSKAGQIFSVSKWVRCEKNSNASGVKNASKRSGEAAFEAQHNRGYRLLQSGASRGRACSTQSFRGLGSSSFECPPSFRASAPSFVSFASSAAGERRV